MHVCRVYNYMYITATSLFCPIELEYATIKSRSAQVLPSRGHSERATINKANSTSYDYIGEDPYLMRSIDQQVEIESVPCSRKSSEQSEVKYSKVTTTIGLKVLSDSDERGELVHLVETYSPSTNNVTNISASYATVTNDDMPKCADVADEVHAKRLATKESDYDEVPSRSVTNGGFTHFEPAPCTFIKQTSSGNSPVNKGENTASMPMEVSGEGIYDLLCSEEGTEGLTPVERIMSIEMLVSDMCKSLEDIGPSSTRGESVDNEETVLDMEKEEWEGESRENAPCCDAAMEAEPEGTFCNMEENGVGCGAEGKDDRFYINVDL